MYKFLHFFCACSFVSLCFPSCSHLHLLHILSSLFYPSFVRFSPHLRLKFLYLFLIHFPIVTHNINIFFPHFNSFSLIFPPHSVQTLLIFPYIAFSFISNSLYSISFAFFLSSPFLQSPLSMLFFYASFSLFHHVLSFWFGPPLHLFSCSTLPFFISVILIGREYSASGEESENSTRERKIAENVMEKKVPAY